MGNERFDIIIIGSGAGGGTIAHALAASPARILILERGDFVPQEETHFFMQEILAEDLPDTSLFFGSRDDRAATHE